MTHSPVLSLTSYSLENLKNLQQPTNCNSVLVLVVKGVTEKCKNEQLLKESQEKIIDLLHCGWSLISLTGEGVKRAFQKFIIFCHKCYKFQGP